MASSPIDALTTVRLYIDIVFFAAIYAIKVVAAITSARTTRSATTNGQRSIRRTCSVVAVIRPPPGAISQFISFISDRGAMDSVVGLVAVASGPVAGAAHAGHDLAVRAIEFVTLVPVVPSCGNRTNHKGICMVDLG